MKEFKYVIADKEGIHARPAGLLVKEANNFKSIITMEKDGKTADVKRIFALMSLGAKCGDEVIVRIDGEDEAEAAGKLALFLKNTL